MRRIARGRDRALGLLHALYIGKQQGLCPDIEHALGQHRIVPGRADDRRRRAALHSLQLRDEVRNFVRRMLGVEQDPVEPAVGNDLSGDVAAQARPKPDLQPAFTQRALEWIRLEFDHDASLFYEWLYELDGKPAERTEIGVQRITLLRENDTGKRAGEHDVSRLERMPMRTDLVGKPGNAERRMAEHARRKPRLLDLRVAIHDAADPAQVDIHRPDWPSAHGDAGGGAIIGNRIDDLARILNPRIDDLDRGDNVFGRTQHIS